MAAGTPTRKILIVAYLLVLHVMAFLYVRGAVEREFGQAVNPAAAATAKAIQAQTILQQLAAPASSGMYDTMRRYTSLATTPGQLMIPVAGIHKKDLQDTYTQSRSGGRVHNACDIMAPAGTPVIAAADGEIAKFFDSDQGGITIYQWRADKQQVYYYAHLQRRAAGIREGDYIQRGTVIGYVGDTGNAGARNFHLHFGISMPTAPGKYYAGTEINPYPLLMNGVEAVAAKSQSILGPLALLKGFTLV